MTRPPGHQAFFPPKPKLKGNGVQTAKCIMEGEVWRQDYKCSGQYVPTLYLTISLAQAHQTTLVAAQSTTQM